MSSPAAIPDPEALPPTFPVQVASRILGIGRNRTYELIKAALTPSASGSPAAGTKAAAEAVAKLVEGAAP